MLLGHSSVGRPPWSEDGELSFNGVGVDASVSSILSKTVVDSFMAVCSAEDGVGWVVIMVDLCFRINILHGPLQDILRLHMGSWSYGDPSASP